MSLYQKIVPLAIFLGVLGGCAPNYSKFQEKIKYRENNLNLFDEPCDRQYNEDPFFKNIPCDEDIFPRRENDGEWVEEDYK